MQEIDVGLVRARSHVLTEVEILNDTPSQWEVRRIETDCGCLQASVNRRILGSGERAMLRLVFDAGTDVGVHKHTVTVRYESNRGSGTLPYSIRYDVRSLLRIDNDSPVLNFGDVGLDRLPAERTLRVRRGDMPTAFDQLQVHTEGDGSITVEGRPITENEWALSVRVIESDRAGAVRAKLIMTPLSAGRVAAEPEVRDVYASVAGPVIVSPKSVLIGVAKPGERFEQRLTVSAPENENPAISLSAVRSNQNGGELPAVRLLRDERVGGLRELLVEIIAPFSESEIDCDLVFEAEGSRTYTIAVPIALRVVDRAPGGESASARESGVLTNAVLDVPVSLWSSGKVEEAIAALVAAPWGDPNAEFSSGLLLMTEAQYAALDPTQQEVTTAAALQHTREIRGLARTAIARAASLAGEGQKEESARLLHAVRGLGNRLSDPQRRMAIVAMVGMSIVRGAAEKMAELGIAPEQSGTPLGTP